MNRISACLLALGFAALAYGAWLLLPAAGYLAGGVLLAVAGVLTLNRDDAE